MTPEVSVIIPTYNRAADLRRALTSVRAQTNPRWEALIVDNHSTDDTRQVVESFRDERLRLIEIHNEGIVARSRNAGILASTGEFVAFLDSDDWWDSDKLERCVGALRDFGDFAFHALRIVRGDGQIVHWQRTRARTLAEPVYDDLIQFGNTIATSSVVVRRSLMTQIGGFAEEREKVGYEDFDAWLKAARLTEKFVCVRGALGCYWQGGGNLLTPDRVLRNFDAMYAQYFANDQRWRDRAPGWLHYGPGRAYYHLGQWRLSLEHMRAARRGRLLADQLFKSILTTCVAAIRLGLSGMTARSRP